MCHLQSPLPQEFALNSKVQKETRESLTVGSHLKATVTYLPQLGLTGQKHLLTVHDWVSIIDTNIHTHTHVKPNPIHPSLFVKVQPLPASKTLQSRTSLKAMSLHIKTATALSGLACIEPTVVQSHLLVFILLNES